MKKLILWMAALCGVAAAQAQTDYGRQTTAPFPLEAGRIYRTEVIPYPTRQAADARNRTDACIPFDPRPVDTQTDAGIVMFEEIEFPVAWADGLVYLHLENVGSAYTLILNGTVIAEAADPSTPAEFALTPYIKEGKNGITVVWRDDPADVLDAPVALRKAFGNSYFYRQEKRSIRDFEVALVPDPTQKFGILELTVIAQNAFNYTETVTVGYDIYAPDGKLLEYSIVERTVPGQSVDTVRFAPDIYHTYEHKWEAGAKNPPLYRVMLFTRRDGVYREYMPFRIGFGKTSFADGRIMRFGKELQLKKTDYNAGADRASTLTDLKALKAKGFNTVCPACPQPAWFYELCDELGLYVIDRANINDAQGRSDRRVGGTPSNDPALVGEYLERVKAMYYRSRNYTCVIAFALGGEAGNGYNMYKAYEWLKSVEPSRPVIYMDADGEWNTDIELSY